MAYAYDALSRMTNLVDGVGNSTWFEYDSHSRLAKKTYADGAFCQYDHTAQGWLTNRLDPTPRNTIYEYSNVGQLAHVDYENDVDVAYGFDTLGRMTSRVDSAGTWARVYDGQSSRVASETLSSATSVVSVVSYSFAPLTYDTAAVSCDTRTTFYSLLFAPNGAVVAHYAYDPFGPTVKQSGTLASPNKWRSTKQFEGTWGFYYYGRRYFQPDIGRWTSRDPLGDEAFCHALAQGVSREGKTRMRLHGLTSVYVFVKNRPTVLWDTLGLYGGPSLWTKIGCWCDWKEKYGKVAANDAQTFGEQAKDEAKKLKADDGSPLGGADGGPEDAVRHCIWACKIAEKYGSGTANGIGDIYEKCTGDTGESTEMDKANNSVGAELGEAKKKASEASGKPGDDWSIFPVVDTKKTCSDLCVAAFGQGKLKLLPSFTP